MLTGDIKGKVIGIPREYRMDGMPDEIEALWSEGTEMLRDAGAEIRDISLPHTKYALPAYYVIAPAEASSNLARYDGVRYGHRAKLEPQGDGITEMYEKTRAEGFGAEVKRRVMIGTYVLSAGFYDAYYNRARRVRALIKKDFEDVFAQGIDAILTPATPVFGLWPGRDDRGRSGSDVSQRRLHRDRQPGRSARHCGACRSRPAGPAAWPAADRAALGRGRSAQHRLCVGERCRICSQTGEMVVKSRKR